MKSIQGTQQVRKICAVVLMGTLAMVTAGCSGKSRAASSAGAERVSSPAVAKAGSAPTPAVHHVMDAALELQPRPVAAVKRAAGAKAVYKSRDYGVGFEYPWQYAFFNARTVNVNPSLRPKFDGREGQFTLARVEVPKGFYPDTNYESGYFTVSLNENLSEQECAALLGAGAVNKESINGVEFRWMETESGGRGASERLRQYVTYANGACYEMEMGVTTRNENALAREVDPDQVMRRLEAMLKTVTIVQEANTVVAEAEAPE